MTSKSSTIIERTGSLRPVHPGRLLAGEMEARGLSASALSLALRVPANRISEIMKGRRAISPETALRLGQFFGNGPRLWLEMQVNYELAVAEREYGQKIRKEVQAA